MVKVSIIAIYFPNIILININRLIKVVTDFLFNDLEVYKDYQKLNKEKNSKAVLIKV